MKAMVRQLLVQRFHLLMHREQKVLQVYALVKTAGMTKLKKSTADAGGIPVAWYSPGKLEVRNATLGDFARFLQRFVLDRPAVDQTGIEGKFDLVLKWTPDGAPAADAAAPPGLFTAVREELGLKLQAVKAKSDVFVVDSAEMPEMD
jgi:uncharacterized protein (TIGR03435 family)